MIPGKPIFVRAVQGKSVAIFPAAGSVTSWKKGKCWSVMCGNPIWFAHLNKNGRADIGYCYCCYHWRVFEYAAKGIKERGDWFLLENGKLVKWVFDQE